MKAQVAEKLIIMGTLLIMAPIVADYLYQRHVVEVLKATSASNVSLSGELSSEYRASCFIAGAVMVVVAIFQSSRRDGSESRDP